MKDSLVGSYSNEIFKINHFRENICKIYDDKFQKKNYLEYEPSIQVIPQSDVTKLFQLKILNATTNFSPKNLEPFLGNITEEKMKNIFYYVEVKFPKI